MVSVCPKHVKEGLHTLEVPHIAKLTNTQEQLTACKCAFCHLSADYRLFNERPFRKNKQLNKG